MKTAETVKRIRNQRILFIAAGSAFFCVVLLLVFYLLFLIFPSLFIQAELIAPFPLIIIFFLLLLIPFIVLAARKPFFGNSFLSSIIKSPYSLADVKAALELEGGKSYPKKNLKKSKNKKNITDYLSGRFSKKIIKHLIPEKNILKQLFPDIERVVAVCVIVILSAALSYLKSDIVADVYTALRTGLPAELIALDTPLKFEKLEAVVIPPAYLESGSTSVTDLNTNSKIKVIQGSSVLIKGYRKSIKSGKLILSAGNSVEYFSVSVNGNSFEATFLAPMKGAFALEFFFPEPVGGKLSGKSKVFTIEAMPDEPPSIKIFFPPPDHKALFGNPIEINFAAADDYGILEISLYHRNPEENKEYYKEIIARFPKEPKTSYSTVYAWNPAFREGEKIEELVYHPGTKMVEYYLEVKDNNIFSASGTARSDIRHIYFTDAQAGFKEGVNIIHELINDGKKLLASPANKRMVNDYKKKLTNAADTFSKELREIMPQGALVQKTHEMITAIYFDDANKMKEALKGYIAYLERLLIFMNLLQETESMDGILKELSKIEEMNGDLKGSLKRIGLAAELFEKEFKKDIEEINDLMAKGDHNAARSKMNELIKKIRARISEELAKSMAMSKKIADEVNNKLENMSKQASDLLKNQEHNKSITDNGNIKTASVKQEDINKGLSDLNIKTEKLFSEYPFIMYSLSSYAGGAKIYGERALQNLKKFEHLKSSQHQGKVIQYLKNFLESTSQQKKLMEELAKGNFQNLMPRGFADRFVLIPKEAVYAIPIDYKTKIIEMSKDRSKNTPEKEAFWKDVLE